MNPSVAENTAVNEDFELLNLSGSWIWGLIDEEDKGLSWEDKNISAIQK